MKFLTFLLGALAIGHASSAPLNKVAPAYTTTTVSSPTLYASNPYGYGHHTSVPPPPPPKYTVEPITTSTSVSVPTSAPGTPIPSPPKTCKAKLELLFEEQKSLSLDINLRIVEFIQAVKAIKIDFDFSKFFEILIKKDIKGDETDTTIILDIFKELELEIDLGQTKKLLGILVVAADLKTQCKVLFEIKETIVTCGVQSAWKFFFSIYHKFVFDLDLALKWFHNECAKFKELFAIDIEAFFKIVLEIKSDFDFHGFFSKLILKGEITYEIIIECFKEFGIEYELQVRHILIKLTGDIDLAVKIIGKLCASIRAVGIDIFLKVYKEWTFRLSIGVQKAVEWFRKLRAGIQLRAFILYCQSLKFDFDIKLFLEKLLAHKGIFDEKAVIVIFKELDIHIDIEIVHKLVAILNVEGVIDFEIFEKWIFVLNLCDKIDDFFAVWTGRFEKLVLKAGAMVESAFNTVKSIAVEIPMALSYQLKKFHFREFLLEVRKLNGGFDLKLFFENWKKLDHRFDFGAFQMVLSKTIGFELDVDISFRLFETLCGGKNYDMPEVVNKFEMFRLGFNKALNKNYNFAQQFEF